MLGCETKAEAERELEISLKEVQNRTGLNKELSLQAIAEEIGL